MKWVIGGVAAILVLLALAVALSTVLQRPARQSLDTTLANLSQQGIALKVEDLPPSRLPEEFPEAGPSAAPPADGKTPTEFLLSFDFVFSVIGGNIERRRAWEDVERTMHLLDALFTLTPEQEEEINAILDRNQDALRRLRQIAGLAPTPMNTIIELADIGKPGPNAVDGLTEAWTTILFILDAYAAQRNGHPDAALDACRDLLRIQAHIRDIPTVRSQFIGQQITYSLHPFLARLFVRAKFTDDAANSFDRALVQAQRRNALVASFQHGVLLVKQTFDWVRQGQSEKLFPMLPTLQQWGARAYELRFWDFLRDHDEATGIALIARYVEAARCPYYEAKANFPDLWHPENTTTWITPVSHMGEEFYNELWDALDGQACHENRLAQARIALALNRYMNAKGAYPETLDVLRPEYLSSVPLDPYVGEAMCYVVRNDGYLLYSVGENGQRDLVVLPEDEPGTEIATAPRTRVRRSDDIPWGMRRIPD